MDKTKFYYSWSELHGKAQIVGIVKIWLNISYAVAKVLSRIKISPNLITCFGLIFAILLYINAATIWAPVLLVLSLFADGIDGTMAIINNKNSKWGALLDSIVDRTSEIFWVLALKSIGVELKYILIVIVFASIQEYIRARSSGLGLSEIGIVTISERPVRAIFVLMSLIFFQFNKSLIDLPVYLWVIFQVISFSMLLSHIRKKLS